MVAVAIWGHMEKLKSCSKGGEARINRLLAHLGKYDQISQLLMNDGLKDSE